MALDDTDLGRFVEKQLVSLKMATDRNGLLIVLSPDDEIAILAAAITAVNNGRRDSKLFRPLRIGPGGQIEYVE